LAGTKLRISRAKTELFGDPPRQLYSRVTTGGPWWNCFPTGQSRFSYDLLLQTLRQAKITCQKLICVESLLPFILSRMSIPSRF